MQLCQFESKYVVCAFKLIFLRFVQLLISYYDFCGLVQKDVIEPKTEPYFFIMSYNRRLG